MLKHNDKKCKDHKGNTFNTVKELYTFYGLSEREYYARKQSGWSLEDILTKPLSVRAKPYIRNFRERAIKDHSYKKISENKFKVQGGTLTVTEYQRR